MSDALILSDSLMQPHVLTLIKQLLGSAARLELQTRVCSSIPRELPSRALAATCWGLPTGPSLLGSAIMGAKPTIHRKMVHLMA